MYEDIVLIYYENIGNVFSTWHCFVLLVGYGFTLAIVYKCKQKVLEVSITIQPLLPVQL